MTKSLFQHALVIAALDTNLVLKEAAALAKLFTWPSLVREVGQGGETVGPVEMADGTKFTGTAYINQQGIRYSIRVGSPQGRYIEILVVFYYYKDDKGNLNVCATVSVPGHGALNAEDAISLSKLLEVWGQRVAAVEGRLQVAFSDIKDQEAKIQRMCAEASEIWGQAWKAQTGK